MRTFAGRRVLVTREREDCAAWAAELASAGAVPLIFPCIVCREFDVGTVRAEVLRMLPRVQWIGFTSRRGVQAFARIHSGPLPTGIKVAAVGPATAEAAAAECGRVDLESSGGNAASLAQALVPAVEEDGRVLLVVAENAGDALERALDAAGRKFSRIEVYRTAPVPVQTPRRAVSSLGADDVLLASPSAVTGFVNQVEMDALTNVFTIGPSTTRAACEAGLEVTREAARPSLKGLLEAMRCAS